MLRQRSDALSRKKVGSTLSSGSATKKSWGLKRKKRRKRQRGVWMLSRNCLVITLVLCIVMGLWWLLYVGVVNNSSKATGTTLHLPSFFQTILSLRGQKSAPAAVALRGKSAAEMDFTTDVVTTTPDSLAAAVLAAAANADKKQPMFGSFEQYSSFWGYTEEGKAAVCQNKEEFSDRQASNQLVRCNLFNENEGTDVPCGILLERKTSTHHHWLPQWPNLFPSGKSSLKQILVRNTIPEPRYVCDGKRILGDGGTWMTDIDTLRRECSTTSSLRSYLFAPHPPPLTATKGIVPPVELFWNPNSYDNSDRTSCDDIPSMAKANFAKKKHAVLFQETEEFPNCPVDCRKNGGFELLSVVSVRGMPMEILATMEGQSYYAEAKVRKGAMRSDQVYATTSFLSEIPLPYYSPELYQIQHPSVTYGKAFSGASFLAGNCHSKNDREKWVEGLQAYFVNNPNFAIDSLSDCLHNAEPKSGWDMQNKTAIQEKYLFHLAFENQSEDDYITEKLWGTLASGTLPVYFGAPNIQDHVPPNSIINVHDFDSPEALGAHLWKVSQDRSLYESYHKWRYKPLARSFLSKYEFSKTHSTCRMCKWAYAMRHGLAWDHDRQEVVDGRLKRRTCLNKLGLVSYPFKEYWVLAGSNEEVAVNETSGGHTTPCELDDANRVLSVDNNRLQRRIYYQDGVTDLVITGDDTERYLLRLMMTVASPKLEALEESEGRGWWMHDGSSRWTILTSEKINVQIEKLGTLTMSMASKKSPLKIRIIVEGDNFYKIRKNKPNYFGDLMTRDFFEPLEVYKL